MDENDYLWPDPPDGPEPEVDLGMCPWYVTAGNRDGERGICAYGCQSEPACQTCEPEDGWSSYEALTTKERDALRARVGAAARRSRDEFWAAISS